MPHCKAHCKAQKNAQQLLVLIKRHSVVNNYDEKAYTLTTMASQIIVCEYGESFLHSVNSLFVLQHLQDSSTTRGQFVEFECWVQAIATVQVHWDREEEQRADSDNFRVLRKSIMIRYSICFLFQLTLKYISCLKT